MGDLASSSFEFYDGVRILLTGALVTAIYTAIVETFALKAPLPTSDALVGLTAVAVSGLFMYFLDLAGRSIIYSARLPHRELGAWGATAPSGLTTQNAYFVLMDTRMPPALRNRAQYYGSIFRVGFDTIVLLGLSATVAVDAAQLCTYRHGAVSGNGAHPVMVTASGLLGVLALGALMTSYVRVRPRDGQGRGAAMRASIAHQIPWVDRLALVVSVCAAASYALWGFAPGLIVSGALGSCLWIFRYVRGALREEHRGKRLSLLERSKGAVRRNIEAEVATLLLCLVTLSVWVPSCFRSSSGTHLDSAVAVGWTLALVAAAAMMLGKGHEGKLWGSHYTVIAWLRLNRARIIAELGLSEPEAAEPAQHWWQKMFGGGQRGP